jgi:hypothetical protein
LNSRRDSPPFPAIFPQHQPLPSRKKIDRAPPFDVDTAGLNQYKYNPSPKWWNW